MAEESIYNLIPPSQNQSDRPALYKSKYPGLVAVEKQAAATFGQNVQPDISPKNFLKSTRNSLSPATSPKKPNVVKRDMTTAKPPVPSRDDKPVYGLVSHKNYLTANAVDNILAVPPPRPAGDVNYLEKEDYGKVPAYLGGVKQQIHDEYELIRRIEDEASKEELEHVEMMSDEERKSLCDGLKQTWEAVNKEYQGLSFTLDTESKKKRKEQCEEKLAQIEKDIGFLSKRFVFVTPDPNPFGGSGARGSGARGSWAGSPSKSLSPGKHFSPASSPNMSLNKSPSPTKSKY
mmetsp:Transcript_3205/g.6346  ORF Transcript_3205/g.6346 Transcript_3205/m.6346 type:complete len:290 (-) Transcript_3205:399-1268(-)|eukprot:CAMPEP_0173388424 /NCGR_PEP_ID=MMETSP1356-20130122/10734_1 /TAXON_ID=77927 ORGANISM="Hemiselmis virescens, Strain PCC157" /NCGR_SAMPLE_ID=MMETSP1356 /ASSEMBLY_ACC=CAM_ASM_000847 /LENGTH=289 /DNA_ID=CAMNT_0014345325 /DNA_START=48 /DNA_END=917 /DNA_ORIENTATION=+